MASKGLTIGSWISIGNPIIAEILAKAGFDWLVIDLEHSAITIQQASDLIRVIDLAGVSPLVRLTSNDRNQIKRVMDAGSHGIIVPMVNTADEAKYAVAATRYPPDGHRGVGLARAQGYGTLFQDYLAWQKDNPVVVVQIEHESALSQLDQIFSVPEVDGFIIGPYDLSCSMGIPGQFDHPDFINVMGSIREAGRRSNKPGGLHIVEPDVSLLKKSIEDGYLFIAYSVDIRMLDTVSRQGLEFIGEIRD